MYNLKTTKESLLSRLTEKDSVDTLAGYLLKKIDETLELGDSVIELTIPLYVDYDSVPAKKDNFLNSDYLSNVLKDKVTLKSVESLVERGLFNAGFESHEIESLELSYNEKSFIIHFKASLTHSFIGENISEEMRDLIEEIEEEYDLDRVILRQIQSSQRTQDFINIVTVWSNNILNFDMYYGAVLINDEVLLNLYISSEAGILNMYNLSDEILAVVFKDQTSIKGDTVLMLITKY